MPEPASGQSGGVTNTGTINTGGGHVVGGNMTTATSYYSPTEVQNTWQPIAEAISAAPPEKRAEAEAKFGT
jgi:hypothetical protein